jgi:integrase/recombinase XerD
LSTEALTLGILRDGEVAGRKFDPRLAARFVCRSTSEETRMAYRRTFTEFFRFVGMKHPAGVVPDDVLRWHDTLRSQRKSTATVTLKLSVVRSFFEHLRAAGTVTLNPAVTKLVAPPEVSSQPAGCALTIKEVRYLLAGPDGGRPDGARDYALMLVMPRLSLCVSEVCSLWASLVKWSYGRWMLGCKVKGGMRFGHCPRTSRRRETSTSS